jgi:hypothetical protein
MCSKVIDTRASYLLVSLASGNNCNYPAAIYSIEFLDPKKRKVIWSISAPYGSSDEELELSTVTYGIIPKGFSGTTPTKLRPGQTIEILIHGVSTFGQNSLTLTLTE